MERERGGGRVGEIGREVGKAKGGKEERMDRDEQGLEGEMVGERVEKRGGKGGVCM